MVKDNPNTIELRSLPIDFIVLVKRCLMGHEELRRLLHLCPNNPETWSPSLQLLRFYQ